MENTDLCVPERSAAILQYSGKCVIISSNKIYSKKKKRNTQRFYYRTFNEVRNLKTQVKTCAGVIFKNEKNYVLVHAVWEHEQENLKGLLKKILSLSMIDSGKKPGEVFLCTTNPEKCYEEAIYEILGEVNLKRRMKYRGKLGIVSQNIAIGRDALLFY